MLVVNGPNSLTVQDAAAIGWIDPMAYYIDPNNAGYKTSLPQDVNEIKAWRGYWLWSNVDGLHLLTPEQQALQQTIELSSQTPSPGSVCISVDIGGNCSQGRVACSGLYAEYD